MRKIVLPITIAFTITGTLLFFKAQIDRAPSSTPPAGSNIQLDGSLNVLNTQKQIKKYILQSWDWHFKASSLFISFENLKLQTPDAVGEFCDLYPNMVVSFEAPNISYSGEHPEIKVQRSCDSLQKSQVNLKIDFQFISSPEEIAQLKKTGSSLDSPLQLQNWDAETPRRWRVKQIVFLPASKDMNENIELTKYEILALLGYSVEFETAATSN